MKAKRIITLFLVCTLMLAMTSSLYGCGKSNKTKDIHIVTTIFPIYDFARSIAGDRAEVSLLLKAGQDIHSYEPSPSDIVGIGESSLFIYIGGESDRWVEGMLSGLEKSPRTLSLMDKIPLLHEGEEECDHHHDNSHQSEYDEHIWTSPKRAIHMVQAITNELSSCDPDGEEFYRANSEAYINRLKQLDLEITEIVNSGKRKSIIVADRFPFLYLTHDYGITARAALSGCAESTEPSAKRVTELVDFGRAENIPVVFKAEMSNGALAGTVASEISADVMTLHSCHSLTVTEWNDGVDYISGMYKNAEALRRALS